MFTPQLKELAKSMNAFAQKDVPFFFVVDFECKQPFIVPLSELAKENIQLDFNNLPTGQNKAPVELEISPMPLSEYKNRFEEVKKEILYGNTYLCNLTGETEIKTKNELAELYTSAASKYKILFKNQWLCFSPETFVKIKGNEICTFPMKGTIDAQVENAREVLLSDPKEIAEHYTIVDLLRNDLSIVAQNVQVVDFRFISEIETAKGKLLQASSRISGELPNNWKDNLGDIFCALLPAGSISGAPKKKTVEIISSAEKYNRAYYTGVAGVFDGATLDSCVLIRFIEKRGDTLFYKSGGGITKYSDVQKEYDELIQKIYVPTA